MLIVAGGGTFLTLWVLSLVIGLMKRIYPLKAEDADAAKKS